MKTISIIATLGMLLCASAMADYPERCGETALKAAQAIFEINQPGARLAGIMAGLENTGDDAKSETWSFIFLDYENTNPNYRVIAEYTESGGCKITRVETQL